MSVQLGNKTSVSSSSNTRGELLYRNQVEMEQMCEVPSTEILLSHCFCSHVHTTQHESETKQDRKRHLQQVWA